MLCVGGWEEEENCCWIDKLTQSRRRNFLRDFQDHLYNGIWAVCVDKETVFVALINIVGVEQYKVDKVEKSMEEEE